MKTWVMCGIVSIMLAAGISNSADAGPATYTIQVTGYVPVICRVNTGNTMVQPGQQVSLGTMTEFCNNPTGYQVWVDYAPGVSGDTIYVDGKAVSLSPSGSTMIDASATAASQTRNISLDDNGQLKSISMRIVPI